DYRESIAARPSPDGGMKTMVGILTYGPDTIRYEVRFLASRQTLVIEVHPDSRVLVRAPLGCPQALIAERVRKRVGWISRQLAEFERYRPRTPARQYLNGESHLYRNGRCGSNRP
ncbi:MAG: DUF45 domain-containing protein, partial [Pseudomonadales bacterium]|nr:DUF45 domain-containing protein [Pseudomonadales bacterium]